MTDKLELLNSRRAAIGKAPLKSWKGSKAKLEEAITALGHAIIPEKPKPAPTPKPCRVSLTRGIDPKAPELHCAKFTAANGSR